MRWRERGRGGVTTDQIQVADDTIRVLGRLFEAAVERVRFLAGDPDCSTSAIAWNEGYYMGVRDALAQVGAGEVITLT